MSRWLLLSGVLLWGCSGSTPGPNQPPVANAGEDQAVRLFDPALIDGGGSYDPEGKALTYRWELVAAPEDGTAGLSSASGPTTELAPDAIGVWVVRLTVSDGSRHSQPDVMKVRVSGAPCQDDQQCDDGLWCNGEERCVDGRCAAGSRDCSAVADQCNTAGCDEEADACLPVPKPDQSGCNDGLYCTTDDICTAGVCSGSPRDCSQVADDCTDASCNEDLDQCEGVPKDDGASCDDGLYCTVDDQCLGGACQSGPERDCAASGGSCVDGTCNEDTDQCEGTALPDGTPCDDQDLCTTDDKCMGGSCTGVQTDCSHLNGPCSQGSCDPSTGQCEAQPINEGQNCDDGDPCTFPDQCQDGVCQSSPACPLGCDASGIPPRCYEVNPSNVGHDYLCVTGAPDLTIPSGATAEINTNDGTVDGNSVSTASWVPQESGARDLLVLSFSSISISQTATVTVTGSHPLALIACGDVEINGLIEISAQGQNAGPGGYDGGDGNADTTWAEAGYGYDSGGGGPGFREESQPYCHTPGGGGGFGRYGGEGGDSDASGYSAREGGAGGQENGNSALTPLVGGSGGGGGAGRYYGSVGGGGGGAIQITAGNSVLIGSDGGIRSGGAGGGISQNEFFGGGGGGGAGGAILIEGASLQVHGKLTANGGGGGGGRADYPGWGLHCPSGTPTPGEAGPHENRRANGGADCTDSSSYPAGDGGRGGAMGDTSTLGERGDNGYIGGGGGGAAGRIRLNSFQNADTDTAGAVISPNCSGGTQRCTTGAVSLW